MPWKSEAQRRWGNSPSGQEALGKSGVAEWNAATPKGKPLPEKVGKKPTSFKRKMSNAFPNR